MVERIRKVFRSMQEVIVSRCKSNGFRPIDKRWIVGRTFSGFDNYRGFCCNYELVFDSTEEMVKLASIKNVAE